MRIKTKSRGNIVANVMERERVRKKWQREISLYPRISSEELIFYHSTHVTFVIKDFPFHMDKSH